MSIKFHFLLDMVAKLDPYPARVVGLYFCLASLLLIYFDCVTYLHVTRSTFYDKTVESHENSGVMLHPHRYLSIPRPLSSVCKVAFVERFDRIIKKNPFLFTFEIQV